MSKVLINNRKKELLNKIANYVIDIKVYTHTKQKEIITIVDKRTKKITKQVLSTVEFLHIYERQKDLVVSQLRTANLEIYEKLIGKVSDKNFIDILDKDDLINNIRKEFILSLVVANEPVGLNASDAVGSNATQVTLNSFHTSGALKDTEASISNMENIAAGGNTINNPSVRVLFKENTAPNNFYDILSEKRKEYVGVKVSYFFKDSVTKTMFNMFSDSNRELIKPVWYSLYEKIFSVNVSLKIMKKRTRMKKYGKRNPLTKKIWDIWETPKLAKKILVSRYELDTDNMYSFGVTQKEISDIINNSGNFYFTVFSPIIEEEVKHIDTYVNINGELEHKETIKFVGKVYIDLYVLLDNVLEIEGAVSKNAEFYENNIIYTGILNTLGDTWVKGIPKIESIYPDIVRVHSFMLHKALILEKTKWNTYWIVYFNHRKLLLFNISINRIKKLIEAADYEYIDPDDIDEEDDDNVFYFENEEDKSLQSLNLIFYCKQNPKDDIFAKINEDKKDGKEYKEKMIKKRDKLYTKGKLRKAYNLKIFRPPTKLSKSNDINFMKTKGSDLISIWKRPDVSSNYTYSNDPHEIRKYLGIEAARNLFFMELSKAINYGGYVDPRHIMLSVDKMTRTGEIIGFKVGGATDISAVGKAVFGDPNAILSYHAAVGERIPITSPNEAVFVNGNPDFGTTSKNIEILFDEEYNEIIEKNEKEIKKLYPNQLNNELILYEEDLIEGPEIAIRTGDSTVENLFGSNLESDPYNQGKETYDIINRTSETKEQNTLRNMVKIAELHSPYLKKALSNLPKRVKTFDIPNFEGDNELTPTGERADYIYLLGEKKVPKGEQRAEDQETEEDYIPKKNSLDLDLSEILEDIDLNFTNNII